MNLKQANTNGIEEQYKAITVQQDGKEVLLITATVGDFECNSTTIENLNDFQNWAIAKVTLELKDATQKKAYLDTINKAENKKTNLYLAIDAESEDNNWAEVLYDEVFNATPNVWLKEEGKQFGLVLNSTKTINIYHDGKISKLDLKNVKEVNYVYHDKNGNSHDLGKFVITKSQKWIDGTKHEWKTKKGGEWKTVKIGSKTRYYKKDSDKKNSLITPFTGSPKAFKYNDSKEINFALYEDTSREYFNPEAFATLIGALADVNFNDLVSNGSVATDGTGAYSVSHFNGFNMDFKYLRKDKKKAKLDKDSKGNKIQVIYVNDIELDIKRQNEFLDALNKFGWGKTKKTYRIKRMKTKI